MSPNPYCFPLSIQTVLPENYRENAECRSNLKTLQKLGFYGVELNIAHPERTNVTEIQTFLQEFDLRFTQLASGLTAKTHQLSLSSADIEVRRKSVQKCHELINFMAGSGAGIIFGFIKGAAVQDRRQAQARFQDSLQQISADARVKQVQILVEATNRYETSVVNTLDEAVQLLQDLDNPFLRTLPDTFHMNIEEADGFGALTKYAAYYDSIHLSDNNRYFPGLGAIKFDELIRFLKTHNYKGGLAIEGNIKTSFIEDVTASMDYLAPLLKYV
jgi:D-psicose/D-tagatose/L-ribulose 3-epimerase